MSHTTSIKSIKIQSVTALRSAVLELATTGIRCHLEDNVAPRAYSVGQQGMGVADHVLRIPDANYDVGFYKQPDGSYEPRTDFFGGSVARVLGVTTKDAAVREQAQLGKLLQMYGIHAASEVARRQGHTVRRIAGENGLVKLEVTGANL